ncbi:Cholecystokinin receptor type A [Eumeta japonica]|uniref:Cholecystokinin receptor type A n=1 Tax=Eumeta variegata TaxID=151549 RepID=A0A4C1ZWD9_EUMVA|nr:Cholecystokinin receptor type A [Eumeta japonica]
MEYNMSAALASLNITRFDVRETFATAAPGVHNRSGAGAGGNAYEWRFILPPYIMIFLLSICGNCLVIATLASNRRMRTVTNVYLLNLAISDFLLGVFCLPFTLVGQIYRRFMFGAVMCKLVPYLQGKRTARRTKTKTCLRCGEHAPGPPPRAARAPFVLACWRRFDFILFLCRGYYARRPQPNLQSRLEDIISIPSDCGRGINVPTKRQQQVAITTCANHCLLQEPAEAMINIQAPPLPPQKPYPGSRNIVRVALQ